MFGLSFVLSSCSLDSEVYNAIYPESFPVTESDVEALVTGNAYGSFGTGGVFNIARGMLLISDLSSDYGECSWRQWEPILYGRWLAGNWDLGVLYTNEYHFIPRITMTIDRIEKVQMDENKKDQYIAELRCGRAWLAFSFYDLYGPIPIADVETLKNPLNEDIVPRMSEEEMKSFIESELKAVRDVLPYSYKKGDSNYGRFTKGLANMILLKFYMLTKNWTEAEAVGRELTKPEYGYNLVPEYKDLYTLANEKSEEIIWSINCLPGYMEQNWHPHVLPNDYPTDPPHVVKWNGWKISWPFFNTFDKKDKRLDVIISEYVGTGGVQHNEELDVKNNEQLRYGAVPFKYQIDPQTTGDNSQLDIIIYRYADAITLLAEAIVRNKGAVTEEALGYLNQVRTRAGLDAYTLSDLNSSEKFLDVLLAERGWEFIYEGVRRQDLIRHGKYVEKMKEKVQNAGQATLINEDYSRFPLPQSIIDRGKGIIKQNPGY